MQFTFHTKPVGYQLYCDPSGGCLIDDRDDRAIVFDGPLHVHSLEITNEGAHYPALGYPQVSVARGLQRTTMTAEVMGCTRILPVAQAKATIGALANASIPELLAALNQRMDERAGSAGL